MFQSTDKLSWQVQPSLQKFNAPLNKKQEKSRARRLFEENPLNHKFIAINMHTIISLQTMDWVRLTNGLTEFTEQTL